MMRSLAWSERVSQFFRSEGDNECHVSLGRRAERTLDEGPVVARLRRRVDIIALIAGLQFFLLLALRVVRVRLPIGWCSEFLVIERCGSDLVELHDFMVGKDPTTGHLQAVDLGPDGSEIVVSIARITMKHFDLDTITESLMCRNHVIMISYLLGKARDEAFNRR
jgi:hypothetical protein